jgi:phage terminase large subunit-like protein
MIAGLALLLMFRDEPFEHGAEIYCAATKERQAKIMYNEAVRIRNRSPSLKKRSRVRKAPHGLHWEAKDSFFCPIGSDSDSTDGLNPHAVLKDELHAWRERHRGLKEKLETGGGARRQPLDVTITTAGDDHSQIWIEDNEYAVRCVESVVTGNLIDDAEFVFIACIDEQDDPFDEACWPKANPNWEVSVKPESVRSLANEAKSKPSALAKLIRYACNRRVGSLERAIPLDVWMAGATALTVQPGATGHGGMDLGRSDDWAAIAACFPIEERAADGTLSVVRHELKTKAWTVKNGAFNVDREPFRTWICRDLLTAHEGDQVDFSADHRRNGCMVRRVQHLDVGLRPGVREAGCGRTAKCAWA